MSFTETHGRRQFHKELPTRQLKHVRVTLPNTCRYSAKLVNKYQAILCYVKRKNSLSGFSTDSGISEHKNVLFREFDCFRICDVELSNTRYAISTKYFELILILCHDSFNLRAVALFPVSAGS